MVNNYLSVAQLSTKLDIKPRTIRAWIFKRQIPYVKIGKLVRFKDTDIEHFLKNNEQKSVDNY